jgi:AraC-like DNA-binding protein
MTATYATDNPELLTESLSRAVGPVDVQSTRHCGFEAELRLAALPRTGLFSLRMSGGRLSVSEPRPFVGITVPRKGRLEVLDRGKAVAYRAGTAHVLNPTARLSFDPQGGGGDVLAFAMDASLVASYLDEASSESSLPTTLHTALGAGSSLARTLRYLWRELQRDDSLLRVPRIGREAEEMLAAMLVEACLAEEAEVPPRFGGGHGAIVRRAEEFLDAKLDSVISLAEVATAVGTSTKTLARAFRKQRGMGPMAFVRRRRLEAARRDLAAADPLATTVTDIALRYGFAHLGRFAGMYREAFGELPSETLAR